MTKLVTLLAALHENIEHASANDIRAACKQIIAAQELSGAERETLKGAFLNGPLFDGDVCSKDARSSLVEKGFMARIVVKGEDGYNACTYKGAWAHRILEAKDKK